VSPTQSSVQGPWQSTPQGPGPSHTISPPPPRISTAHIPSLAHKTWQSWPQDRSQSLIPGQVISQGELHLYAHGISPEHAHTVDPQSWQCPSWHNPRNSETEIPQAVATAVASAKPMSLAPQERGGFTRLDKTRPLGQVEPRRANRSNARPCPASQGTRQSTPATRGSPNLGSRNSSKNRRRCTHG